MTIGNHQSKIWLSNFLMICKETQFSFWNSLVLAAAEETGCNILLSEDLNDGQIVHNVKIVNPFKF